MHLAAAQISQQCCTFASRGKSDFLLSASLSLSVFQSKQQTTTTPPTTAKSLLPDGPGRISDGQTVIVIGCHDVLALHQVRYNLTKQRQNVWRSSLQRKARSETKKQIRCLPLSLPVSVSVPLSPCLYLFGCASVCGFFLSVCHFLSLSLSVLSLSVTVSLRCGLPSSSAASAGV